MSKKIYILGHHAKVSGQYRQCPVVKDSNYWYAGFDGLDYKEFKQSLSAFGEQHQATTTSCCGCL